MDILKVLARFNVQVILCLAGVAAAYFSFFSDLPNSSNSFTPSLRSDPVLALLLFSGVLILGGCGLLVHENIKKPMSGDEKLPGDGYSGASTDEKWVGPAEKHPLVVKWWKSSNTQKEVVAFLYEESHRNTVPLDKFYTAFCEKNGPDAVGSIDELYFRMKSLEAAGFLHIESVGPKVTNIVKRQQAKLALRDGDIIKTGG